jgi:hypothetical protein
MNSQLRKRAARHCGGGAEDVDRLLDLEESTDIAQPGTGHVLGCAIQLVELARCLFEVAILCACPISINGHTTRVAHLFSIP